MEHDTHQTHRPSHSKPKEQSKTSFPRNGIDISHCERKSLDNHIIVQIPRRSSNFRCSRSCPHKSRWGHHVVIGTHRISGHLEVHVHHVSNKHVPGSRSACILACKRKGWRRVCFSTVAGAVAIVAGDTEACAAEAEGTCVAAVCSYAPAASLTACLTACLTAHLTAAADQSLKALALGESSGW